MWLPLNGDLRNQGLSDTIADTFGSASIDDNGKFGKCYKFGSSAGAGISDAVLEFLVASGEILLVTTPEPTSITDSYSLLKALNRHPRFSCEESKIKVIANKVDKEEDGITLFNKLNVVVQRYLKLPIEYLGAIPQDDKLVAAVMQQTPVSLANDNAKSSMAYEKISARLMNKEVTGEVRKRGMAAFFSHIVNGKRQM